MKHNWRNPHFKRLMLANRKKVAGFPYPVRSLRAYKRSNRRICREIWGDWLLKSIHNTQDMLLARRQERIEGILNRLVLTGECNAIPKG